MTEQQQQFWRYWMSTAATAIMVTAALCSFGYAGFVLAWALSK